MGDSLDNNQLFASPDSTNDSARPPSFAEERRRKRELLEELRASWEAGQPAQPEELLRRWPTNPDEDPDVGSLLFEDYCQRNQRDGQPADKVSLKDYEERFPQQRRSLARLFDQHSVLRSLGGGTGPGSTSCLKMLALPSAGDEVFGFRLRLELGHGTFARVFLAQQKDLADRAVVLKVSAIDGDEPQTLAQLQHTHIVPIYSVHEDPQAGLRAVCMPYFGGASLSMVLTKVFEDNPAPSTGEQFVRALAAVQGPRVSQLGCPRPDIAGPLEMLRKGTYVQAAAWLTARLAEALQHAHDRGILHRDIKPSNVLIAEDGEPMLLDFNLSQKLQALSSQEILSLGGTVSYMAPEHLRALFSRDASLVQQVNARADIYSLGLVFYEFLIGKSPFDHSASYSPMPAFMEAMAVERSRARPSLRQQRKDVPWSLHSIAVQCLAADPAVRYQRADHLAEDLQRFVTDEPLRYAPEPSVRERAHKWMRRNPRLTTSAAIASCCAPVVLALMWYLSSAWQQVQAAHHRVLKAEQAESRDRKTRLEAGHQRVLCLGNTTLAGQDHLSEVLEVSEQALALFGVLDNEHWQRLPHWEHLAATDRQQLGEAVREILLLRARSVVSLARLKVQGVLAQSLRIPVQSVAAVPASLGTIPGNGLLLAMAVSMSRSDARPVATSGLVEGALRQALILLDRAEAIRELEPSLALLDERAGYLDWLGQREKSQALRKQARNLKPSGARDHYWRASTLAARQQYHDAIVELDRALDLNPKHYWSWLQRGCCHEQLGELTLAVGDFNACIALWPAFSWGYFNRGCTFHKLGLQAEALADFNRVLAEDPSFAVAYFDRGMVYLALQKYVQALADFDTAVSLGKADHKLEVSRALALEYLGRHEEADRGFAAARKRAPLDSQMQLAYGFAVMNRQPERAEDAFRSVLAREPRNARAFYGLGVLATVRSRVSQEGLEFFQQAIEADPAFVDARRGRAYIAAHLGDWSLARQDMDLCIKSQPTGVTLYAGACVYALLSRQAAGTAQARWAEDRALDLLRLALEQGYGQDKARSDSDLQAIGNRREFGALIQRYVHNK